jgi:hypothetical protein
MSSGHLKYMDGKKIVEVFADIIKAKKHKIEIQRQALDLEEKIKKYKDVLPLAKQIAQLGIGIDVPHSA